MLEVSPSHRRGHPFLLGALLFFDDTVFYINKVLKVATPCVKVSDKHYWGFVSSIEINNITCYNVKLVTMGVGCGFCIPVQALWRWWSWWLCSGSEWAHPPKLYPVRWFAAHTLGSERQPWEVGTTLVGLIRGSTFWGHFCWIPAAGCTVHHQCSGAIFVDLVRGSTLSGHFCCIPAAGCTFHHQ